jgi:hypothetical protein
MIDPRKTHRPSGRTSIVSHPDRSLASRLTRTTLLEPTTREVGARPIRWSLLALPLVVAGLVFAVREVGRVERVLAAEGSRAARVIVYELKPGTDVRVPIEPGTEVFRIVAHAVRKTSLTNVPHDARLLITASGERGTRTDDIRFAAPGTTARVTPEDSELVVGDPVAVNVDVHDLGRGELTIALTSIVEADGVLVRIYRREAVSGKQLVARPERLGPEGRAHLAKTAGELSWDELELAEQEVLLAARWKRVAALPHANKGLPTHAVAVSGPPMRATSGDVEPAITVFDLRGDERGAVLAHGKVVVRGRADGDEEAIVHATVRHLDGRVDEIDGKGEVTVEVAEGAEAGIELTRSTPGILSIRASDPNKLEGTGHVGAWRTTKARPAVVNAGNEPIVLRVSARRPVPRDAAGEVPIVLDATISAPSSGKEPNVFAKVADPKALDPKGVGGGPKDQTVTLRAMRARSIYERYDVRAPSSAPTASAVFHVLVPAGGSATLAPAEGEIDLSLAELDPGATPRPVRAWPADGPGPAVRKTGDQEWGGFVGRWPSNAGAFQSSEDGRTTIRIPHRLVPLPEPQTGTPSFRIKRPPAGDAITRNGRLFDPTTVSFEIDVPAGEALVLPVRAYAKEPLDLIAKIDGDVPDRRDRGVAERITTARKIAVTEEVRSIVVLGDDLPAGKHVLTFVPPPGKKAWVHLPWMPRPRLPGAPPPDPHWIEGDLED